MSTPGGHNTLTVQPTVWGKSCTLKNALNFWRGGNLNNIIHIPFSRAFISPPPHSETHEGEKHGWVPELASEKGRGNVLRHLGDGPLSNALIVMSVADTQCQLKDSLVYLHSPPAPMFHKSFLPPFILVMEKKANLIKRHWLLDDHNQSTI